MSENRKILKIGIIIILITLALSLVTSLVLRLDKPVFLQTYTELQLTELRDSHYSDSQFELRYITNANDNRVVNNIELIDTPELNAYASEYNNGFNMFGSFNQSSNTTPGRIEGMYSIRSVNVSIDAYNLKTQKDDLHLTKVKVYFSDGESEIFDIGDIVIYNDENAYEYFDFKTSGGS